MSNLATRALSGLVICLIFVSSILWLPYLFDAIMLIIALIMLFEWYEMTNSSFINLLLGLTIIPIPIISLLLINLNPDNRWTLLIYFVNIWSVDTFAMISGKTLKGPKLAPYLSPNKTWSGLVCGSLAAAMIIMLLITKIPAFNATKYYLFNSHYLILNSFGIAVIAQLSDLFISYFKRKFKIKDSGNFIPGHGGVLDRFDSIILTAPLLFLALK